MAYNLAHMLSNLTRDLGIDGAGFDYMGAGRNGRKSGPNEDCKPFAGRRKLLRLHWRRAGKEKGPEGIRAF